jgi:CDP-paratose 2-epimerase
MTVLITGICGFVGSTLASFFIEHAGMQVLGIDNLMRPGSERNRTALHRSGVRVIHGDMRAASDFAGLPPADWVVDAAANPSVLAGVQSGGSSRQLFEHNLAALVNVLEYCKERRAGLLLLSSSRVYSIPALAGIPLVVNDTALAPDTTQTLPAGVSARGIDTAFCTEPPVSLYGATKLASELMALEYGAAFEFPVWINRCGVLAGAGQFGTADQGIFTYWVNAHLRRRPLRFIGFEGKGYQTRDAFHPIDLGRLLVAQIGTGRSAGQRLYTVGGGPANSMSLTQLTQWCDARFGSHVPTPDPKPRAYDVPWVAMDNSDVQRDFDWRIEKPLPGILEEIAEHARSHADWLEISGA